MLNRFAAPIDYLLIGYVTSDVQTDGSETLGGTVSFGSLTAKALNMRPGILTSISENTPIEAIESIPIAGVYSEHTTTFENIYTDSGRIQMLHHTADKVHPYMLPEVWRNPAIVHFAPLFDEIDLDLLRLFPESLIGVTPQGWLRRVDENHQVHAIDWLEAEYVLGQANATVLSIEDLNHNEEMVERYAAAADIFVVTEGEKGCRLFTFGQSIQIPAPENTVVDATGAGDVFAAVFFTYLYRSEDPEKAARIATKLATHSISRHSLNSVPLESEIYETLIDERSSEWVNSS